MFQRRPLDILSSTFCQKTDLASFDVQVAVSELVTMRPTLDHLTLEAVRARPARPLPSRKSTRLLSQSELLFDFFSTLDAADGLSLFVDHGLHRSRPTKLPQAVGYHGLGKCGTIPFFVSVVLSLIAPLLQAENSDDWSYKSGVVGGWIPKDPNKPIYPNICA